MTTKSAPLLSAQEVGRHFLHQDSHSDPAAVAMLTAGRPPPSPAGGGRFPRRTNSVPPLWAIAADAAEAYRREWGITPRTRSGGDGRGPDSRDVASRHGGLVGRRRLGLQVLSTSARGDPDPPGRRPLKSLAAQRLRRLCVTGSGPTRLAGSHPRCRRRPPLLGHLRLHFHPDMAERRSHS